MKSSLNLLALLVFICINPILFAQNMNLEIGTSTQKFDKPDNFEGPYQFAKSEKDFLYTYTTTPHVSGSTVIYPSKVTFKKHDANMNLVVEKTLSLKYPDLKLELTHIIELNNQWVAISVVRDRKTTQIAYYYQELNLTDFSLSQPKEFYSYSTDDKSYITKSKGSIKQSENQAYFLLNCSLPDKKGSQHVVFDMNFDKVYDIVTNTLVEDQEIAMAQTFLTNNGDLLFYTLTIEESEYDEMDKDYHFSLIKLNKEGDKLVKQLSDHNRPTGQYLLTENSNGDFLFICSINILEEWTSEQYQSNLAAKKYARKSTQTEIATFLYSKTDLKLLSKAESKYPSGYAEPAKFDEKKEAKFNKDKKSGYSQFSALQMIPTTNSETFTCFIESCESYYHFKSASGVKSDYFYTTANTIVFNIGDTGEINWSNVIPKYQRELNQNFRTLGIVGVENEEGDVQLFYNDSPSNSSIEQKNAHAWLSYDSPKAISMVTISKKGEMRKSTFSIPEKTDVALTVDFVKQIDSNHIILYLLDKKQYSIGKLTF